MKTLLLLTLIAAAPLAHAESKAELVINHPVLTSLEFLLQSESGDRCELPETKDIQWACMGLIPPAKKAEILAMGCHFSVKILCPSKSVEVRGESKSYYLNSPRRIDVAPTREEIVIKDVRIVMP